MNAGECYQAYCALRAHFTTWDYDYFKYQGRSRTVTPKSFDARTEKGYFERLARQKDAFGILLANLSEKPRIWVGDLDLSDLYKQHRKRIEGLTYYVCQDILQLGSDFNANFNVQPGSHPRLIKLLLAGIISLQTAAVLVELTGCGPLWRQLSTDDTFFTEETRRIIKYAPFLEYDRERMRKQITKQLTMNGA